MRAVDEIEMPNLGDVPTLHRPSVDCVKYYGLKITTEHGRAVIDYRNDSNGYYGGSIELLKEEGPLIYMNKLVFGDDA